MQRRTFFKTATATLAALFSGRYLAAGPDEIATTIFVDPSRRARDGNHGTGTIDDPYCDVKLAIDNVTMRPDNTNDVTVIAKAYTRGVVIKGPGRDFSISGT